MKYHPTTAKQFIQTPTARLAVSYLTIIMLMSIGFSFVFYNTSAREVGKHIDLPRAITESLPRPKDQPPQQHNPVLEDFFRQRAETVRHELLMVLIFINLLVLAGSSLISYYLARRTLHPIEANMEAQTQFVSDASHELRTPLTALQTTNEVAIRQAKITSDEAKTIFQQNVDEVMKLRRLTDSLLNLAKHDFDKPTMQPTQLSDIVSQALNTVVVAAVPKHISIEDHVPNILVKADKSSLTQAVVTILDNAVKYSAVNSTIHIFAEKQGKFALLKISDQGVGIEAVHLPHIFDRFYRVDDSRSKQRSEGFGIGLALAQKITEQHGGSISVQSVYGKGSTFSLKLPLS